MSDELQSAAIEAPERNGALFGPEQLDAEEASRLLARGPGRLVVLLGERGAGKTTLCTELYERQRHPGSNVNFAGSWTLLAFEQLAYERRTTGAVPPAARADLDPGGHEILHLAMSANEGTLHLLLADLPGEVYRRLADNYLAADEVPWLRRADKLVLLVDGERLLDPNTRSATLTRVRQLLERLQSVGLPHPQAGLALLVSKWDKVGADRAAVTYWEPREAALVEELRAIDQGAVAVRIAAAERSYDDGFAALRAWLLDIAPSRLAGVPASWQDSESQPPSSEPPPDDLTWPAQAPARLRRPWWRWRR
jgi:hypothetical protein